MRAAAVHHQAPAPHREVGAPPRDRRRCHGPRRGRGLRAAGRVRGRPRREQDRDPPRGRRTLFKVTVTDVRTLVVRGKVKRVGRFSGQRPALEEGVRDAQGRRQHRVLRGSLRWRSRSTSRPRRVVAACPRRTSARSPRASPRRACSRTRPRPPAATTTAASPRGSAAAVTSSATAIDRLQAQEDRRARRRSSAIEYDPNRSARIALLQYADGEKAYILAPQQPRRRRHGRSRRTPPTSSRATRCRSRYIPVGTEIHAVELKSRPRRAARPLGRHQGHADGEGGRLGHAAHALGRDAPRPHRLPRHGRRDRQLRARATSSGARPAACAGWASARTTAASR